jgi:long-chain acyl-CoA synthetase
MLTREARLTGRGSPFELTDTAVNGIPCRTFRHGPQTLGDLYRHAAASAEHVFLVHGEGRWTSREVFARAHSFASLLSSRYRIRKGARVGLLAGNQVDWLVSFIAITSLGGVVVAPHSESENCAALVLAECMLVIADGKAAAALGGVGYSQEVLTLEALSEWSASVPVQVSQAGQSPPAGVPSAASPDDLALIAFTSGSTGHSKGVMITHRGLLHGLKNMLLGAALSGGDRKPTRSAPPLSGPVSLLTAPFSHVGGYSHLLLMLYVGGRVVLLPEQDPELAQRLVRNESVTTLAGAAPHFVAELLRAHASSGGLESLRSVGIHGVSLLPQLLDDIGALLPEVTVGTGYGLTETNGSICVISGTTLRLRPTSSGKPLPSVDLRIVGEDMQTAPAGAVGEIAVRGAMLMHGYSALHGTANTGLEEGWFKTGDLGCLDADGFLHVTDRAAHMLMHEGQLISCRAVESSVLQARLVREVAVVGMTGQGRGARLVLAVVPETTGQSAAQAILEHARQAAPFERIETEILWLTDMPRTPSGKVDRRAITKRMLETSMLSTVDAGQS